MTSHLPYVSAGLGDRIQHIVHLVSTGLLHQASLETWPDSPKAGRVGYQMAPTKDVEANMVRQAWGNWITACGLRDISELVPELLERAHASLIELETLLQHHAGKRNGNPTTTADATNRFHKMGLPAKLSHLEHKFQFQVPPHFTTYVTSINTIRNCLVHRDGLVTDQDLKDGKPLTLEWQPLRIVVIGPDGEREINLGETAAAGERISLVHRRQAKQFRIGERISLTSDEFAEVAWTIFRFGAVLDEAIKQHAATRGVSVVPVDEGKNPHASLG